ncbi:MAG: hypothetical protein O7F15_05335, partial [Gammaproteobacteria bacterium]|nr:hypothetical protein [Gammaproteobacteria bacterium]
MKYPGQNLKLLLAVLFSLALTSCGGGDYDGFDSSVTASTPNKYLAFFNRQGDLSAGSYTLVIATTTAGQTGSFSVLVKKNDGSSDQLLTGSWVNSFGPSASPLDTCTGLPANVCFSIDLHDATGASFELSTALDGYLYLVDDSDTPEIVGEANDNGAGGSEILEYSESEIDESSFAAAYYATVDPANARDTLQKFQSLHGFDTPGADVHVIFRDSKDLGYGRDMYMRSYANPDCGGQVIAFYVRNFLVQIVEGFAYGPVNLQAAINQDLQHHFGSNAIEFSRGRSSVGDTCSSEPMAKFYTFRSDYSSPGAVHPRLLRIDLDGRGTKAMPQPCISCHGGKLRPLDRLGQFVAMHAQDPVDQIGDTKARMQAFEVDTFEFSDQDAHTRAKYEDGLRQLNAAIYCTYPGSSGHAACASHGGGLAAQTSSGEWSGDFGREMLLGWYNNDLETVGTAFDDSFVPSGWVPAIGGPPVGADALFKKVIGPNCFVCHGKRGTELGSNSNASGEGKDLDFSSWDKFISHASEIERLLYDEGRMPLGLLNYNNFWGDPEKAELLGSFIAPFVSDFAASHIDGNGNIIPPGRIVARAGPDRVTQPNAAISLNAQASLFASSYSWALVSSPGGSVATISSPGAGRTDFSADMDGEYTVRLTASEPTTATSSTDDVTIMVDTTLTNTPRRLTFYTDISARLATCASTCHSTGGGSTGGVVSEIPVWWVADATQPQGLPSPGTPSLGFYEQVLTRVNLETIEDSLILKKPSDTHHYGGLRTGFNTGQPLGTNARVDYDMFTNWIAEGA